MELFKYYSLDECIDRKSVKKRLNSLEDDGKIDYKIDGEILRIEDLDLDEDELSELLDMFDSNDIFPYPDYEEGMDEDDDYGMGYDDYDDESEEF